MTLSKKFDINQFFLLIMIFVLVSLLLCRNTESFMNFKKWVGVSSANLGYPRPQGNLSNFTYGTTKSSSDKMRKKWNDVLKP